MLMFVWRYMICHLYFSIIQFWVNLLHLNICFNGDYQQRWLLVVIFSVKETWSQFESIPSNLDFCCCWFFSNVLINLKKKYIYQKLYNIIFELSNVKIWKLFIYFMHPKGCSGFTFTGNTQLKVLDRRLHTWWNMSWES